MDRRDTTISGVQVIKDGDGRAPRLIFDATQRIWDVAHMKTFRDATLRDAELSVVPDPHIRDLVVRWLALQNCDVARTRIALTLVRVFELSGRCADTVIADGELCDLRLGAIRGAGLVFRHVNAEAVTLSGPLTGGIRFDSCRLHLEASEPARSVLARSDWGVVAALRDAAADDATFALLDSVAGAASPRLRKVVHAYLLHQLSGPRKDGLDQLCALYGLARPTPVTLLDTLRHEPEIRETLER